MPLSHPDVPVLTTDHPPWSRGPSLLLPGSPLRSPRVSPPRGAGANLSRQIRTGSVRSCLNMLLTRWIFRVFIHFPARNLNVIYFQHHISCSYLVCYLSEPTLRANGYNLCHIFWMMILTNWYLFAPSTHPMVYLSIFSCKSCKVAVNDHQINHKSSYSLMTITGARVATCSTGITCQTRVRVTWHRADFFTNTRFVANIYYGQQICWKTFPLIIFFLIQPKRNFWNWIIFRKNVENWGKFKCSKRGSTVYQTDF